MPAESTLAPQVSNRSKNASMGTSPEISGETLEIETFPKSNSLTPIDFDDRSDELGLHFVFETGATGKALMPEATGGGCGWIDFDRDGVCLAGYW